MSKVIYILICSFALSFHAEAQKDSTLKLTLLTRFSAEVITDFTTDNLGNVYLITASNQLKKYNSKGDSISGINDVRRFGKITSIDATNPLKVLIHFKDFSRIVVLDRLLNVRNAIDLRKLNIFQMQAYTVSYDNNIWLYDELDSKLKKIDDQGKVLLETNDFRQVFDNVPTPNSMFDRDGLLYLYDPLKGLITFDYYGALKNNIPIKNISDLQVIDKNTITGRDSSSIILYKPATLQMFNFRINNLQEYKKLRFDGLKLYALSKDGALNVFSTQ